MTDFVSTNYITVTNLTYTVTEGLTSNYTNPTVTFTNSYPLSPGATTTSDIAPSITFSILSSFVTFPNFTFYLAYSSVPGNLTI